MSGEYGEGGVFVDMETEAGASDATRRDSTG